MAADTVAQEMVPGAGEERLDVERGERGGLWGELGESVLGSNVSFKFAPGDFAPQLLHTGYFAHPDLLYS